ncbi:hypothetical protein [Vibrio ezurae]|uniref:hypothetical protein n=1 Tax=Vibrio ezurae TaxID=252583 RepID=UPI0012EC7720|nr:hypothetical protein [Vibrio ezurae]
MPIIVRVFLYSCLHLPSTELDNTKVASLSATGFSKDSEVAQYMTLPMSVVLQVLR